MMNLMFQYFMTVNQFNSVLKGRLLKETRSVTMNIFRKRYFLFNSFVKIELSYVFTINMFITVENCTEK